MCGMNGYSGASLGYPLACRCITHSGFVCRSTFSHILLTEIISFISILCLRHNAKAVYSWLLKISFAFSTKKMEKVLLCLLSWRLAPPAPEHPRSPASSGLLGTTPGLQGYLLYATFCLARRCTKQLAPGRQDPRLRRPQGRSGRHRARRLGTGDACSRANSTAEKSPFSP